MYKFRDEKRNLEQVREVVGELLVLWQIMDCKVETTDDLYDILKYVTSPEEGVWDFVESSSEEHFAILVDLRIQEIERLYHEEVDFINIDENDSINTKQTKKNALKNDMKIVKNEFVRNMMEGIQDLGVISFQVMRPGLKDVLRRLDEQRTVAYYR